MDFLEFLKSSCYYSDVRFDMRDNMIYKWQTSEYTGFSLYKLNDYEIRVDYCGSATGYTLQHYSADYNIYQGGSYTGYDLRDSGYGDLRLYKGSSLYGQGEYMKEKEEKDKTEQVETLSDSSSASSSSNTDDDFSGGFWSWKSWGFTWLYLAVPLLFVIEFMWYIGVACVAFMVIWMILLIIHKIRNG